MKIRKLAALVRVFKIRRISFHVVVVHKTAKKCAKISLQRTCTAIVLLIEPFVW